MPKINFAFILGNPRSGTSLLRLMLNAHMNIISPPECGFMQWWYEVYKDWNLNDNCSERLDDFIEDLFNSKKIESWCLDKMVLKKFIQKQQPANYNELSTCVYLSYGKKTDNIQYIIDKNNYYIHYLDWLVAMWPNSKIIHLVRDGRDVACSYRGVNGLETTSLYKPNLTQNIDEIAKEWRQNNLNINQLSNDFEYLLVRYEDLLNHPKKVLKKICNFLNLRFDSQMLKYYELEEVFLTEPKETLDWKKKTREKPDISRIGQYHSVLNIEEIKIFENIAKNQLQAYGYK